MQFKWYWRWIPLRFSMSRLYIYLRNAYIPKYYSNRPSVLKFIEQVQTKNTSLLIKLSIYCIKAFTLRNVYVLYNST